MKVCISIEEEARENTREIVFSDSLDNKRRIKLDGVAACDVYDLVVSMVVTKTILGNIDENIQN